MSTWDEKAKDEAMTASLSVANACPPDAAKYGGFLEGARWQREALLTDEVVERAARAMDENFNPDKHPIMAAMFRDYARAALMAAIEGEQ